MSLYLAKPAPAPEIVKAIRRLLPAGIAPYGANCQNENSCPDG
jgi:hypothetical protein